MFHLRHDDRVKKGAPCRSPDAQALAGIITQGRDQASLKKIAEDAAKGDTSQLNQLIQNIVRSPGGAELLKRLSGTIEKK